MKKQSIISVLAVVLLVNLRLFAFQEEYYSLRRQKVMDAMEGGIAFLMSGNDSESLNKNFYYLTGIEEPGATLVLIPDGKTKEILFNRTGEWDYAKTEAAAKAFRSSELNREIIPLMMGKKTTYISFGQLDSFSKLGRGVSFISTLKNINSIIVDLRVIKDDYELKLLKKACEITAEGLNDVFKAAVPGMQEKDLALILEYGFARRRSPGKSFLQAASGPNSTNIHFGATKRELKEVDMIVFDVGAYWDKYTADISRTVPASGKFTKEQREIYQVVLDAQKAAIKQMVPGSMMEDVKKTAEDVLIEGLYKLGLVLDKESNWQRRFFIQHGFYHFIGLDVHDVWYDYIRDPSEKVYQSGMVMTMEPGLYFPEDRLDSMPRGFDRMVSEAEFKAFAEKIRSVYMKYANIGVRIEDDVLITKDGNVVLTSKVPKEIDDIEEMMKEESPHNQFKF